MADTSVNENRVAREATSGSKNDPDNAVVTWKATTEQSKKTEVIKEIHQLEIKVKNLGKEKQTHMYSRRSEFRREFSLLEDMDNQIHSQLKIEKTKLRQQLWRMRGMVSKFHRELQDVRPTPEFVEKLKVIMEEIEDAITTFKEQQRTRYEELIREEKSTLQEISALEKRFEAWSQAPAIVMETKTARSTKAVASARDITKDLPPEVAAFERFLLQTGGHRGGWDEYDNQTFLKFRRRYKGKIAFIQDLIPSLPTKTEGQIRDHESWFQEYIMLNDRKKEAIQKWREKKEKEKDELLTHRDEDISSDEEVRSEAMKKKIENEKMERFSQLNAWKVQKELEKAQEEEKRLQERIKQDKEKAKEKERQREVKSMLEDYKTQREEEEEFLRLEQEAEREAQLEMRRQEHAKHADKIKQRNQQLLNDRKKREQLKSDAEAEKKKRLDKLRNKVASQVTVNRDPSRLMKMTKGWEERKKEKTKNPSDIGGRVLTVQHRAVPGWRQGVH